MSPGVDGLAALPSALVGTYAYCEDALVERFHDGVDVSVVVLETDDGLRSLEPVAIEYEKGHEFDFSARYTAEFVSLDRPDLPEEQIAHLGEVARQAHRTLGLRDVSRSDFIVDADGSFVVLETAITPGTTETSAFPFACTISGTLARRGRPRPAAPSHRGRPARLSADPPADRRVTVTAGRYAAPGRAGSARRSARGRPARRPPTSAGTSRSA